jgi:hypothetical protein
MQTPASIENVTSERTLWLSSRKNGGWQYLIVDDDPSRIPEA